MSTGPDLQVKITTQGDSAAIRAMAGDMAKANEQAESFGHTLTKLTNDQLLALEEKLRAEIKATEALGKSTEQLKQQLTEVYTQRTGAQDAQRAAEATRAIGAAARTSADQFGELKRAGGDVAQVFSGLRSASEGGSQGLLGMLTAGRGLLGIFSTMGSVLAGPIGIGLGAAAAGIAYLGRVAGQSQAAIAKMVAEDAAHTERMKARYAALEAAAAKSLDAQIARVNQLSAAFSDLIGMMDTAAQRSNQLDDAKSKLALASLDRDEQAALAAAKTPKQREKVQLDYAGKREAITRNKAENDALNQRLRAGARKENAEEVLRGAQQEIDAANLDARQKRDAFEAARSIYLAASRDYGSDSRAARTAMEAAQAARREAMLAEEIREKVAESARNIQRTAREEIDRAKHSERMVSVEEETRIARQQAGDIERRSKRTTPSPQQAPVDDGRAAALAEQRRAIQDQLDRRPGLSNDPRNADLTRALARIDAQQATQAISAMGHAISEYDTQVTGAVQAVTTQVSAARMKAQRLAEAQAMMMSLSNQ